MEESRLWGILGILLALAGLVVIVLDHKFLTALGEGHIGEPIVFYVLGVAAVAVVTIAVVGPSIVAGE
jgi:drug/metabolite transporter (DMT)-like permease